MSNGDDSYSYRTNPDARATPVRERTNLGRATESYRSGQRATGDPAIGNPRELISAPRESWMSRFVEDPQRSGYRGFMRSYRRNGSRNGSR